LREWNFNGLLTWCGRWRCATSLRRLTQLAIADARRTDGVVHIWGHSWEIDSFHLWDELRAVLNDVQGQPELTSMTNSEAMRALAG
jgi:hypothetical protein